MEDLYKFSPIEDEQELDKVLTYITSELEELCLKLLGQKLPINTLKIFAHYPEEYEYLYKLITNMGPPAPFNSNTSYYAQVDRSINGYEIKYIGIRVVDPYRMHVGCGDYEIANYEEIKTTYANKNQFIRKLKNEMIEIWHPDFDVLGYVVPPL